jgi:molecular chaperone IbpA
MRRKGMTPNDGVPESRAPPSVNCSIEEDLKKMNRFDFTPYRRSTVGFDRLFDLLESSVRQNSGDNYPPFNIERRDEDTYRITLAVAGFRADDIDITAQQNLLIVQGKKRDEDQAGEMLHVGIANRGFERRFELADYVRVEDADLADGLLVIDLVREVPDAMKPKKIALPGQSALVENTGDDETEEAQDRGAEPKAA